LRNGNNWVMWIDKTSVIGGRYVGGDILEGLEMWMGPG
jgi:hypothetical protein